MQPAAVPQPVFINLDYLFSRITEFFAGAISYIFSERFLTLLHIIAMVLVLLLITAILYGLVRLYEIQQEDKRTKKPAPATMLSHGAAGVAKSGGAQGSAVQGGAISGLPTAPAGTSQTPPGIIGMIPHPPVHQQTIPENPTWTNIRAKLLSDNESDWRLAIIEADIYLESILRDRGYPGDTLADKLKSTNRNDLPSLQNAWDAHMVRNRIAHDGQNFTLTQPEARRVLANFEIVFRDLGVIA